MQEYSLQEERKEHNRISTSTKYSMQNSVAWVHPQKPKQRMGYIRNCSREQLLKLIAQLMGNSSKLCKTTLPTKRHNPEFSPARQVYWPACPAKLWGSQGAKAETAPRLWSTLYSLQQGLEPNNLLLQHIASARLERPSFPALLHEYLATPGKLEQFSLERCWFQHLPESEREWVWTGVLCHSGEQPNHHAIRCSSVELPKSLLWEQWHLP